MTAETQRATQTVTRPRRPTTFNPLEGLTMAASDSTRKPLARTIRRTDAARLDVRRAFRFGADEDAAWQEAAITERVEYSEYIRECITIGHSLKQGQRTTRRTSA